MKDEGYSMKLFRNFVTKLSTLSFCDCAGVFPDSLQPASFASKLRQSSLGYGGRVSLST
jgi:hypothetical protein